MLARCTYSPYGAWELKRNYQRNLLLANVIVILVIFGCAAMIMTMPAGPSGHRGITVEPDSGGRTSPTRPPKIKKENGVVGRRGAAPEVDIGGTTPVPVPDEFLEDVDEQTIYTQQELSDLLDYVPGGTGEGGAAAGAGSDEYNGPYTGPEELPGIEDFVPMEKYPEFVFEAVADYPRLAKLARLEGTVVMYVLVDKEGKVRDAAVGISSGGRGARSGGA